MPDETIMAQRAQRANERTLAVVEEIDAETAQQMSWLTATGSPPHSGQGWEHATFLAEAVASLAETVADLARAEKNRQRAAARERKRAQRAKEKEEEAGS